MKKYLWLSDTHLNFVFPWTLQQFINSILKENPTGIFLTGDIACGISVLNILKSLAKKLEHITIYFVTGNHDFYTSSFQENTGKIKELTQKYSNLVWISQQELIPLNKDIVLIGDDGWYDARLGNPLYINYNFDWIMIDEFIKLKTYQNKLEYTRKLADASTERIKIKLENALKLYKTVYLCTHVPPWKEATRALGTILEDFWLPYNVNSELGRMIEKVMDKHHKQNIVILAGHCHIASDIRISHNIECRVLQATYLGMPDSQHHIFI